MAELDFKHNVPQIPAGGALPDAYKRTVGSETNHVPDYQGAVNKYAENTNWMSTLGSTVAIKASDAIATRLGTELGKNPQGDIGYSFTDFDKTFQENYRRQSESTLSLQANKLITDSNLEMAKAVRLTPELISQTNQQVSLGLQNIFKNAPLEIRPHLEYQFESQQLSHMAEATKRMIGEQREDQRETLLAANAQANQNGYELARRGNEKAAESIVETIKKNTASAVAVHNMTPAAARVAIDSAQKSVDAGIWGAKADEARQNGTYEEFAKKIAEKPPEGMSYQRWQAMLTNVSNENAQIHNMKMQSEQVALSQFKLDILENPNSPDIASKLQDLKGKVSNASFIDAQIGLLNIQQKSKRENVNATVLANNWTNVSAYNNATAKERNKAFIDMTSAYIESGKRRGINVGEPEAEVNIAVQSPGPIKAYVDKLNTKIHSGNPQLMEEAGYAIEHIHAANKGDVLEGIDDKTMSMLDKYNALKQQMPSVEAAAEAKRIVYGKTPEEAEAVKQAWSDHLKKRKGRGETDTHFFFKMAGLSESDFVRFPAAYGRQLENTYHAYFDNLGGDDATAQKQLQRTVDQVYGYTNLNGNDKEFTLYPIEKVLGLPDEAKPVILNDVADQMKSQFEYTNQKFKEGKSDWFFEVGPRNAIVQKIEKDKISDDFQNSPLRKQGDFERKLAKVSNDGDVMVLQHFKDGSVKIYHVIIQASPYATKTVDANNPIVGGYDILLKNDEGTKNIALANPMSGGMTYHPNVQKIKNEFGYILSFNAGH